MLTCVFHIEGFFRILPGLLQICLQKNVFPVLPSKPLKSTGIRRTEIWVHGCEIGSSRQPRSALVGEECRSQLKIKAGLEGWGRRVLRGPRGDKPILTLCYFIALHFQLHIWTPAIFCCDVFNILPLSALAMCSSNILL